jgi:hypothetical protein
MCVYVCVCVCVCVCNGRGIQREKKKPTEIREWRKQRALETKEEEVIASRVKDDEGIRSKEYIVSLSRLSMDTTQARTTRLLSRIRLLASMRTAHRSVDSTHNNTHNNTHIHLWEHTRGGVLKDQTQQ